MKKTVLLLLTFGLTQALFCQKNTQQKLDELMNAYSKINKFNGSDFEGRPMTVNEARPMAPREGGGGGGRGGFGGGGDGFGGGGGRSGGGRSGGVACCLARRSVPPADPMHRRYWNECGRRV